MLDFEKHKKKWKEAFPTLTEAELKYHFDLKVTFWEAMIDNYKLFRKRK